VDSSCNPCCSSSMLEQRGSARAATSLDLSCNGIGERGGEALEAALKQCPAVRELAIAVTLLGIRCSVIIIMMLLYD